MSKEGTLYQVAVSVGGYRSAFVRANSVEEAEEKAINGEIEGEWSDYTDYRCEECEPVEDEEA